MQMDLLEDLVIISTWLHHLKKKKQVSVMLIRASILVLFIEIMIVISVFLNPTTSSVNS